ncbi:MAG: hypothetical protein L6R28_12180 [Planctomycetes bacterium]|nr:hypothetical protein [Planctomycetota bacterium]
MNKQMLLTLVSAGLLVLVGCGGGKTEAEFGSSGAGAGKPTAKKTETTAAVKGGGPSAPAASGIGPQATGDTLYPADKGVGVVKGKVTLVPPYKPMSTIDMTSNDFCKQQHGTPIKFETIITDENKGLKNAMVYVSKGLETYRFEVPKEPVEVDQKGCQYIPHVFGVMAGQTLNIRNSDETLHNVNAVGYFNFGQPKPQVDTRKFDDAAAVHFKCDAHAWMSSKCNVFDHSFFVVTKDDGSFELPGKLVPGKYTISAWHEEGEKYAAPSVDIEVKDDGSVTPAEVNFAFDKK